MRKVEDTIGAAIEGASDRVSIGEMIDAVGHRGQSALVLFPALALVSPLSGIPGMTTIMGAVIALSAGQMALGLPRIWLPARLRRMMLRRARLDKAAPLLRRTARFIDNAARPRLRLLVSRPAQRAGAMVAALLGLTMPVLEFIPFSSSIAGAFIAIMMAGFFTRDGLIVALSILPFALIGATGAAAADLLGTAPAGD